METPGEVFESVRLTIAEVLGIPANGLDPEISLLDLGFDSISLAKVVARLNDVFDAGLLVTDLFAHPSVAALSAHISARSADSGC